MKLYGKPLLSLEVCAWGAGLFCVVALLGFHVEASRAERLAAVLAEKPAQQAAPLSPSTTTPAPPPADTGTDGVIGRLDVPALGLRVPILNDYDPASLRRGVGHMQGTAVPGGLGNLVLAGHRDTYFRPLRNVRNGMVMRVITPGGTYDYIVDSTSIVTPDNIDVLDIRERPEMTLITCYPFDFIGAAPKRFIVRAHLVSLAGEAG